MPRTSTQTFLLDVSKLPVLGKRTKQTVEVKDAQGNTKKVNKWVVDAPTGVWAETVTVKTPDNKEIETVHYGFNSNDGLTAFLNAGLGHIADPKAKGEIAQGINRVALARYLNSLNDQNLRAKNTDPVKMFISNAEKRFSQLAKNGNEKAKLVVSYNADPENKENVAKYTAAVRALAQKMYDASQEI